MSILSTLLTGAVRIDPPRIGAGRVHYFMPPSERSGLRGEALETAVLDLIRSGEEDTAWGISEILGIGRSTVIGACSRLREKKMIRMVSSGANVPAHYEIEVDA